MRLAHQHPQHVIMEEIAIEWLNQDKPSWNLALNSVYNRLGVMIPPEAERTELLMNAARMADTLTR